MNNLRAPTRVHRKETERFTLTWDSGASSWWHVTAFRLASIKYLCVRLRSRSSFFSKASWDVDKLSKYFIMTSDIMELTSTISGRASASGVRHLREDSFITTVQSTSAPARGLGRWRLNSTLHPPWCLHPREPRVRWTSSVVLNPRLFQRHLTSLGGGGRQHCSRRSCTRRQELHTEHEAAPWASGQADGVIFSCVNWLFSKIATNSLVSETKAETGERVPNDHPWCIKGRNVWGERVTSWPFPAVQWQILTNLISECLSKHEVIDITFTPVTVCNKIFKVANLTHCLLIISMMLEVWNINQPTKGNIVHVTTKH